MPLRHLLLETMLDGARNPFERAQDAALLVKSAPPQAWQTDQGRRYRPCRDSDGGPTALIARGSVFVAA